MPLCLLPNVPVTLRHAHRGRGAPAHDGRNHGEGCPGFEHPRAGRVPQIVEPALHSGTPLRSFPGFLPAANWLGGIGAVRAGSFEAISRRVVSLVCGKTIPF